MGLESTLIRTYPGSGVGTGIFVKAAGAPAFSRTIAFM